MMSFGTTMADIFGRAGLQDAGKGYTLRIKVQHWVSYSIMITSDVSSTKWILVICGN